MENNKIDKIEKNIIQKVLKVKNIFKMPENKNMKITFEKTYQEEPFQKELEQRVQLLKELEKNPQKDKINQILKNNLSIDNFLKNIFKKFTNNEKYFTIKYNNNKANYKKNYNNIYYTGLSTFDLYNKQKKNIIKYQDFIIEDLFNFLLYLYKSLNEGGSFLFLISIPNLNIINFIYYLSLLFEEVYIINKFIVFCKSLKKKNEDIITIKNIIKNNYIFNIEPKNYYKKIIKYFKDLIKIDYYYKKKLMIENKFKTYIYYYYTYNMNIIKTLKINDYNNIKKNYEINLKNKIKIVNNINKINIINNNIYLNELKRIN
jgi:hypothetical protein